MMSWFASGEGAGAENGAGPGEGTAQAQNAPQEGTGEASGGTPDLTGKPDWMPDAFWGGPPEEGKAADWQGMAQKMAGALKEGRQKITEQGELLAKHTVPDSVAPYFEGVDKAALLEAHARSGLDEAQVDQFMAQARSAGIGPGPARAMLQSWVKSRHEATPETPTEDAQREKAVAELNAAGRPGSEIARRVRTWGAGLLSEGKLSEKQAQALARTATTSDGLEALHAIMGSAAVAPVGQGRSQSAVNQTAMEDLEKRMSDPRFGDDGDPAFTQAVLRDLKAHQSVFTAKYGAEIRQLESQSLNNAA